ncbi:Crp/Fnr family transcriptional regulator [Sphingomonas sp. IC-11]|uniref:Crp/Fnr family transcriptional regulator n=1 Tax=Sphingomonas sp. IC-11 TaxID=2898528 RepID=UPI001E58100F|nr:Crp/Fnr family transcriptional regulator [Sphingomonas sp. IC-11]
MSTPANLAFFSSRMSDRAILSYSDSEALAALPHARRRVNANAYIIREGEPPRSTCALLISGLAFRQKLTADGARQIISVHLPGELLDLQHLFLNIADHSVQTLTEAVIADIARDDLESLMLERPAIARAFWVDSLIEASIFREWVLSVGRRDARARIAHILCELAVRMRGAGLIGDSENFVLPMTQEQLGDATGLTSVHVNRTIKALAAEGLIKHSGRSIMIANWKALSQIGDFNPLYLHLDQVSPRFAVPMDTLFVSPDAS